LFFEKIADRKIILKTDNEQNIKQYHLVIEYVRIRTQIEGILKDCAGTTLDWKAGYVPGQYNKFPIQRRTQE
jgi:hypothetical protein